MATKPDVVGVGYHASFPYAGDPFYLANPAEQDARGFYYQVNRTPAMFIDGPPQLTQYSDAEFEARYVLRKSIPSPAAIELERTYDPDLHTGHLLVRVIAEQALAGDPRLRVAVIENDVPYEAWNGISIHQYVFRKFLPDTTGTPLAFSAPFPDTAEVALPFAIAPDWAAVHCEIVAFVQEQGSRELVQGGRISAMEPGTAVNDPVAGAAGAAGVTYAHITSIEPNPFPTEARIRFQQARPGPLRLTVHDAQGRIVRVILDHTLPAGAHDVRWDGRNAIGREAGSGVYFFRLSAPGPDPPATKALRLR
jgi:hypothetical protein